MKFQNTLTLLGAVAKKGSGTLDNGKAWESNRVELHFLTDFDVADSKAVGQTTVIYKIADADAHFAKAVHCIGQRVVCDFEMVPSTKPGVAPKVELRGFNAEQVKKAG